MRKAALLLLLSPWIPSSLFAQTLEIPRFEIGAQADFNYLSGVGEWGGGIAARVHYNFTEHLALDSQLAYRQHNITNPLAPFASQAAIGQATGLFGLRAGQRFGDSGLFVHARAGFLHFGSANGASLLSRTTLPAFEVGGTYEHYSGPLIFRLDLGDLIIPYGSTTAFPGPPVPPPQPPPARLGTRGSPLLSLGFAFRF